MKDRPLTILVLGVGGNVGQGILKALNQGAPAYRVIGACISPLAYGLYTTERSYLSPYFNAPHFVDWLIELCQTEKVDVILTGVEPILNVLAEKRAEIKALTGAIAIVSDPATLQIAQDKWLTSQWLEQHHFPFARYALTHDAPAV